METCMEERVYAYMRQHTMIAKRDRVVVACSGGADSMALLLLLWSRHKELGFEVEAFHVEHGIRGEESKRDAAFVRDFCLDRNIPYACARVDAPAYASEHGLGLEEAARILRYEALQKRADDILTIESMLDSGKNDCSAASNRRVKIALAHHAEDNAETVLFQMVRGSGLDGVCGMAPMREEKGYTYIRPLLASTRPEIEDYLAELGQTYCTDSTNEDTNYSRNFLRKEVLPQLTRLNDQAIAHINQTAEQLTMVSDFVQAQVEDTYKRLVEENAHGLTADRQRLLELHPMLRREVLLEMMASCCKSRKDLGNVHVLALEELLTKQSGKKISLPYRMEASICYDKLRIAICSEEEHKTDEELQITADMLQAFLEDGEIHAFSWKGSGQTLEIQVLTGLDYQEEIQKKAYTKTFDYDKMKKGFCVRKRRDLDYFVIDEGHHKTLSTYCIDSKIPTEERSDLVVVAQESEIIWLFGYRISENYKLTSATKTFVRISYHN